jgi:hypothetical protein
MCSYSSPVFAKCAAIAVWFWRNGELALTGFGYPGVIPLTGKWTHGCKFVSGVFRGQGSGNSRQLSAVSYQPSAVREQGIGNRE